MHATPNFFMHCSRRKKCLLKSSKPYLKIQKLGNSSLLLRKWHYEHPKTDGSFVARRNYAIFKTIYHKFMELMCNIHSFAYFILDDEDIESRPACFSHVPSMGGMDFLVTDLELMLDMFYTSLSSYAICGDEKLHIMFELLHTINNLLKTFEKRYGK